MTESEYVACTNACLACARECERCLDDAMALDARALDDTIRIVHECSTLAYAVADLMCAGARFVREYCRLCALVAEACASACDRIPGEAWSACASTCRACAEACRHAAGQSVDLGVWPAPRSREKSAGSPPWN